MQPRRRTSRRSVQVGRWSPQARRAQQTERALRRNVKTRKGRLSHKHVQATEYKGKEPLFKKRIAVDRGAGFIEFPNFEQFERLAKREKVPTEDVEKAFGHMRAGGRRTSRRAKKKRRTSRKKKVRPNAQRQRRVRRDNVFVPVTRDGEEQELKAITALVPQDQIGVFGSDRGILATAEGQTLLLPYETAFTILDRWLTKKEFRKAFGHLREQRVLGDTPRRRRIPLVYGPHSMKLGHRSPPGEGPPRPGIVKGQLVLYHRPSGSIVWQAYDDEFEFPHKPIWIWFGAGKGHFDFPKAMSGAKIGRGDRAEPAGAVDRGIPPMAMLQAFDYLLPADKRSEAYRVFASM